MSVYRKHLCRFLSARKLSSIHCQVGVYIYIYILIQQFFLVLIFSFILFLNIKYVYSHINTVSNLFSLIDFKSLYPRLWVMNHFSSNNLSHRKKKYFKPFIVLTLFRWQMFKSATFFRFSSSDLYI